MKALSDIEAVTLDFDGVIVDSMLLQEKAWRAAVREVLESSDQENQLVDNLYAGKARERMFDDLLITKEQKERLRETKDRLWWNQRLEVPLMEGVADILPKIAQQYSIAIATTADRPYVEAILKRERLTIFVKEILTDDDVEYPKPSPEMIVEISRRIHVPPQQLCLVGDTVADMEMSQAADCLFIMFLNQHLASFQDKSLFSVSSWTELEKLFGVI